MAFLSDILKKIKKPVDALKNFLTPKERTSLQEKEKPSPVQRVETKLPSFEYKPPSFEGLKSFASSFIPPKEAFERKELASRETPEERAARMAKAHETTKKIAEFGKAVLRAGPRAAASVTLEAQGRRTMIPETKAEKFLFGEEPLESITERVERFPERAKEFGIQEPTAKKIAPFAVLGLTALDILPPLPGKSGLKAVAKKALTTKTAKEFVKAITKKESDQILKAGFKSIDDFFRVTKSPSAKASTKIVDELKAAASAKSATPAISKELELLAPEARKANLKVIQKGGEHFLTGTDFAGRSVKVRGTKEFVEQEMIRARGVSQAIPKELESFVSKAGKHKDVNSFIREIADDTYAPEFRNPIADFWRKKYVQPLSKGSKATFTTDVVAFERNLDDVLNTKYAKDQLANMSVRQKAEIVNGKEWTDLYAGMLDNNLFKFQTDFFKAAKGASQTRPTIALKEALGQGVPIKPSEELKKILYHGTDLENVPKIQKGGFKVGGFLAHGYPQGVYFTTTKKEAQNYGKIIQSTTKLKLSEFFDVSKHKEFNNLQGQKYIQKLNQIIREAAESKGISVPKATAKQVKQYTALVGKQLKDPLDISDIKTATLQKLGYKGFIAAEKGIGKEIVIFDPKDISMLKAGIKKEIQPIKKVGGVSEVPKQILGEAQTRKDFALSKINNEEWMGSASMMSREMVKNDAEKSVEQIAKESFDYLKYRAGLVDETGYPLDKVAQKKLSEVIKAPVGKPSEALKAATKKTVAVKAEGTTKSISQLENESAIAELKAKFKSVEQKNVPISEIRNFPSAEGREIVENAKKEILEGKRFPLVLEKITEGKNAGKYKVLDGNYRAQAYKELGIKDAPAITQASAPVFEHGKPVTTPVIRQAQKGFENTDKFRGGTWYSTPESKTFDFTRLGEKAERGVGGPKKIESTLEIKKPLVIKDAIPEDGSFSVINSGYENFLPKKHQELGNELYERIFGERGLMDKSLDEALGPKEMKWANQDILTDIGKKLGLTEARAKSVAQSTNGYDAMMDLIIGDGLRQKGYDALILENSYQGKVVDRHIFKFTEAQKAMPTAELKEILKVKPTAKLPDIPEIKSVKAIDLSQPAKAAQPSKIQEIIGEYQKRINTIPAKKAATPIRKTLDDTYTAIIDRFHPITKLARKATDLRPGENPELLARRYLGIQGIAESKLFWNTTRLTAEGNLEVTGPGLSKILRPAKDKIDDLRTLMIAERDIELSKRTLESGKKVVGTTPQKSKEVINALKQKHGEAGFAQLSKTAQGVREWSHKALLDPLLEVGAISKEQYSTITKSNKFYVPFQRVIEELETHGFVPKKVDIFSPKSVPIKKIKGSAKDIIDPFESMITNAYKVTDFVERARVGRSIANLRNASPELAEMIKPIRPKIVPVAKHGEELIFRPSFFAPDKNTIMVFENGKRKFYQVPEDVFKAVSGMMESDVGVIMKVLAFPARTLRAGATLTPEFMGRNPLRDQLTAFVFSKYGYVPGVDLAKGIFNTVGKTDLHGRWLAGGGAHSMLVSLDRVTSQATLAKVLGAKDIKGMVKNPIEALRMLSEFGEKGTRVGAFGRAVKKGVSDLEAAFESRDITLDFARRGSQTRAVNMLVAFWNAQVQGLNKTVRAFRERPMQTTFKAASGITLPSVLLYLNNRNDPRYQELPQWQKDLFWILPIGDKGPIIRIPKPFEVGIIFGTVPEHILTWMDKNDPEALTSAAKTLMEASAPGYIPTGLQPIIENVANYSFFRQRPIVSEGKQALPKELQAERYTSETAKEVGKLIKQSPAKIENLFVSYTGGLGKYALDASDKLLKTLGVISPPSEPSKTLADRPFIRAFVAREPIGSGSESVNKFYKFYDEANQTKAAVKGLAEGGKETEAVNYLRNHPAGFYTKGLNKVARTFSDLRKKRDAVLDSRDLNPEQKKRAIDALDKIMTEIARQTVELVETSNEKFRQ